MDYLHWAKVYEPVRYELTGSGVAPPTLHGFDAQETVPDLTVRGPYRNPALIEAVSRRYDVAASRIVPVPGANAGIFVALAATCQRDDCVIIETPCCGPVVRAARFLGLKILPSVRASNNGFRVSKHDIEAGLSQGAHAVFLSTSTIQVDN